MSHGGKRRAVLAAGLLGVAIVSLWLSWPLPPFDYNLEANFNNALGGNTYKTTTLTVELFTQ